MRLPDADRLLRAIVEVVGLGPAHDPAAVLVGDRQATGPASPAAGDQRRRAITPRSPRPSATRHANDAPAGRVTGSVSVLDEHSARDASPRRAPSPRPTPGAATLSSCPWRPLFLAEDHDAVDDVHAQGEDGERPPR